MTRSLHLSKKQRKEIEDICKNHLPDIEVWAYGSRVNGKSHDGSDLDLVLSSSNLKKIPQDVLQNFIDVLQESNIPFLIDVRDRACLPESFYIEIKKNHVVIQKRRTKSGK